MAAGLQRALEECESLAGSLLERESMGIPPIPPDNSMEVRVTKRLSHGLTNQSSYTWSKSLGVGSNNDVISTRDPNNRNLDHARLTFDRTHVISSSGTYALPFGANQPFIKGGPGWLQRVVAQWQLGALMRIASGSSLDLHGGRIE